MRKFLKKIICIATAGLMTASLFAVTACDGVYKSDALKGDISGEVTSNGGFAVKKGGYIYFINGKQSNTADNTFGNVETGALMRISESDLEKRNYADTETVVPEIIHSGNYNGGLFIYGDYVYYSTPSTEKNSDGEIQNSTILFKSAKLDGTEVMKGYYAKYTDNSIEYRFVEAGKGDDKTVYLLYLAKSEDLYGSSHNNLHSVNTKTGTDTLLAYNVDSVMFDSKDVTNPRVFYTMNVTDFRYSTSAETSYNQIYTVTADATTPNEYDFSDVKDYDAEKDPLYVNCGQLVYDGIGKIQGDLSLTQFNADELKGENALDSLNRDPYKYTLSNYENHTLFYTRPVSATDSTAVLFAESEDDLLSSDHKPATGALENKYSLTSSASNASSYRYIFKDGKVDGAFISDTNGLIKTSLDNSGKLVTDVNKMDENADIFYVDKSGTPTILFIEGNYIYYSVAGNGNGLCIKRVDYTGNHEAYNKMPSGDEVTDYKPVKILDLDCSSSTDWYLPEMFDGRIFFSTLTETMTEYNTANSDYTHIMVCDINGESSVMTNKEIKDLNELYEKIEKTINEVDDSVYENLKNAYRYAFYTGSSDYIDKVIDAYVAIGEKEEKFWSKESLEKIDNFVTPDADGDWKEFADKAHEVNGKEVFANQRDYYYALLGTMTEENAEAYAKYLQDEVLKVSMPEEELGWFESLSAGAKAGFLIGVIGGGLLLIGAGVVVALVIVRKRKEKLPAYTKTRIKVDTTDDKSVDVYATDEPETSENTEE